MSVLLVDGACRAPLLAAEPGLATLIKLSSRLPGYSQPWQNERRTLAARTLCSCIQRDGSVRSSLISSGLSCCESALGSLAWLGLALGCAWDQLLQTLVAAAGHIAHTPAAWD